MEKCPLCGKYSVVYEEYYKRKVCLMSCCGWSELSSTRKSERIRNRKLPEEHNRPTEYIESIFDSKVSSQSTLNIKKQ